MWSSRGAGAGATGLRGAATGAGSQRRCQCGISGASRRAGAHDSAGPCAVPVPRQAREAGLDLLQEPFRGRSGHPNSQQTRRKEARKLFCGRRSHPILRGVRSFDDHDPTEQPIRAVERQRLTICLRIPLFNHPPLRKRFAPRISTPPSCGSRRSPLCWSFRTPPNRVFPLIRRRLVRTVSTIPRIEAHGALRTGRCHGRRAVGVERAVRLGARCGAEGQETSTRRTRRRRQGTSAPGDRSARAAARHFRRRLRSRRSRQASLRSGGWR